MLQKCMKENVIKIVIAILIILSVPASLLIVGCSIPSQFSETYYGELSYMYARLKNTDEKKIVIIGNSAVSFGIRPDLIEQELLGYKAVNFGLYGTIGTKAMLDLAKGHIGEGDIIILAPETIKQSMSLFFSANDLWMAADSDISILSAIANENRTDMVGGYIDYLADKAAYFFSGSLPEVAGVYTQQSFCDDVGNEVGYITYGRPYNIMRDLYDSVTNITFNISDISQEFIDYINEYAVYVRNKGAKIYFSYSPMNELSIKSDLSQIEAYEQFLYERLNFDIISNATDYIMDARLFYDTNFHCNNAGAVYHTERLVSDIKRAIGDNSKSSIILPDIPVLPDKENEFNPSGGDNSDSLCFTYEMVGSTYAISGLTADGMTKSEITVPYSYDDKIITRIITNAFVGCGKLKKITVQNNINQIQSDAFNGCLSLTGIYIEQIDPTRITVAMDGGLLSGVNSDCKIYIPIGSLSLYQNDYTWEVYRNYLRGQ